MPSSEKDRLAAEAMERGLAFRKALRLTIESIRPGSFKPFARPQRARSNWDSPYHVENKGRPLRGSGQEVMRAPRLRRRGG